MSLVTQIFAGAPPRQPGSGGGGGGWGAAGGMQPAGSAGVMAQALVNSTVYRCAALIGGTSAALPPRIVRRGDATRQEIRRDEHRYIWGRPNPQTHRINHWESAYTAALVTGDAHLWRGRGNSGAGPTEELWYLEPHRVRTGLASDHTKVFELDGDRRHGYTTREILHVPALSSNGVTGHPPIETITRPFNIIHAAGVYGERFLRKGTTLAGVLSTEADLEPDEADELKERWRENVAGLQNSHEIVVLGKGAKFVPVAVTQEQAQYIQTLEHWELRIAQAYGCPPHMLGIVGGSTSWGSGIEQQVIGFVQFTLLSWIIRFEQAIEDDLLPSDLQMKFVLNGLLRGDTVQRFGSYRTGIMAGFMSPNQARELEDWAPRPGGDEFVTPTAGATGQVNGGGDASNAQARLVSRSQPRLLGPGGTERVYTTADADDFTEAIAGVLRTQHYGERMEADLAQLLEVGYCPNPGCEKKLATRVNPGAEVYCPRCKQVVGVVGGGW
ncbi:MAG: phage portal protein [Dehalococcoidia bacterium]